MSPVKGKNVCVRAKQTIKFSLTMRHKWED